MVERPRELRLVITAPAYDAALAVYHDALGLPVEAEYADDNGGRATLLNAGRATVELGDERHADAIDAIEVGFRVAGRTRIAFHVADAAEAAGRLVAAGADQLAPPTRTPWGSVNARLSNVDGEQLTVYSTDPPVTERLVAALKAHDADGVRQCFATEDAAAGWLAALAAAPGLVIEPMRSTSREDEAWLEWRWSGTPYVTVCELTEDRITAARWYRATAGPGRSAG